MSGQTQEVEIVELDVGSPVKTGHKSMDLGDVNLNGYELGSKTGKSHSENARLEAADGSNEEADDCEMVEVTTNGDHQGSLTNKRNKGQADLKHISETHSNSESRDSVYFRDAKSDNSAGSDSDSPNTKDHKRGRESKPKYVKVEETDIPDEESGFPSYMMGSVVRGKCIPINKKTWTDIDIDGNDSILDCASQVVPLMIKKPNIFPPKLKEEKSESKDTETKSNHEDSEDGVTTEDEGVKEAEEAKNQQNNKSMLTISNFYSSSVGSFLMGIGLSRSKEWFHRDAIKQVQRAIRKEGEVEEFVDELKKQHQYYSQCKAANSIFTFKMHKCHMCEFKTESEIVLEGHYSIPHVTNRKEYKCNYCVFITRDPRTIIFHFQNVHKKQCLIEVPPQLYECPTCPYESSQKGKAANHFAKCMKIFNPEKVCYLPDPEAEYPCITPKPITQDDIKVYEATLQALRPAALTGNLQVELPNIPGLPKGLQYQILVMQQQQLAQQNRSVRLNRGFQVVKGAQGSYGYRGVQNSNALGGNVPLYGVSGSFAKSNAPQLYHMLQTGGHTQLVPVSHKAPQGSNAMHLQAVKGRVVAGSSGSVAMQKSSPGVKPNILGKNPGKDSSSSKSGTFVICEICDGYIKDLEQLRTHMQWIHKVKIHPKMLASRPPLNCQKCQWRFFTDQGLERHLLGAHGLVTSNMQDMVDQNQDGGRCTICGRVFANKLVAHMNQVHKITLRPAHLSYKCTVCSATFNLYRLFENHVYMVHSGSVKRGSDK